MVCMHVCPECGSSEVWKDGGRYDDDQRTQRYVCKICGRCFSDSTFMKNSDSTKGVNVRRQLINLLDKQACVPRREDARFHVESSSQHIISPAKLESFSGNSNNRRVCATETKVVKNLTEVAPAKKETIAKTLAEKKTGVNVNAQKLQELKGKIVEYALFLKKEGYKDKTIFTQGQLLQLLVKRGADLFNPESVKETIARQSLVDNTKSRAVAVYSTFLRRFMGGKWQPPKYAPTSKIPFIPTEREIDQLISGCGKKTAPFLQLLKETAMRSGEAYRLTWADVDAERRIIRVTPEKGSNPRIFKVSSQLIAMLNGLPKLNDYVFGKSSYNSLRGSFMATRKRLARKLGNPRLLQIHFHTLRHWKATMLFYQKKDILYVKKFLGHRSIESTLIYIHLEEALYQESDEFTVRVSENLDDAVKLTEVGFEYVTKMADDSSHSTVKIFRKRK